MQRQPMRGSMAFDPDDYSKWDDFEGPSDEELSSAYRQKRRSWATADGSFQGGDQLRQMTPRLSKYGGCQKFGGIRVR